MKQDNQPSSFSVKSFGSFGQEILGPDGTVIAWTTDAWIAQVIARLLTQAEEDGLLQCTR